MLETKRIVCVIPARLKSTRFPRKMLSFLKGKPLLQWVYESAKQVSCFDEIIFALDSEEVASLVKSFGGFYHMTDEKCLTGTDRLVELCKKNLIDADIWVNWQGDEPFIRKEMIGELLQTAFFDGSDVWTLKKKIKEEEATPSNVVKVVTDARDFALYFSRSQIPFYQGLAYKNDQLFFKHIGIYAFTREALLKISEFPSCELERAEQLEQLRFLYYGLKIRVHATDYQVFGIDLPEHLAMAAQFVQMTSL